MHMEVYLAFLVGSVYGGQKTTSEVILRSVSHLI